MSASEQSATRSGIQTLNSTASSIDQCLASVRNIQHNLLSSYQGSDGKAAGDLIAKWIGNAEIVLGNLRSMEQTLEHTLVEYGAQQAQSRDEIQQQQRQGDAVFDALSG
ncbi:WXG100 family type VII secretion target [Streptomyces lonarensis]|uniref:Uncharacterized protein n=1 Tax=Streptomyces lonarensis TaxID=700599 RepID=A0A7X6HZD4_9ACTN|nr:WXG100 family type VII secretion target [Streptomyces lonarensis]NJQ06538.1 hypothetical protein [Streptomyces lonarensis]